MKIRNPFVFRNDSLLKFFGAGLETVSEKVLFIPFKASRSLFYSRKVELPAGVWRTKICYHTESVNDVKRSIFPLYAYTKSDGRQFHEYIQQTVMDTWGESMYFLALKDQSSGQTVKDTLWSEMDIIHIQYC
jgi:hypothetical protein